MKIRLIFVVFATRVCLRLPPSLLRPPLGEDCSRPCSGAGILSYTVRAKHDAAQRVGEVHVVSVPAALQFRLMAQQDCQAGQPPCIDQCCRSSAVCNQLWHACASVLRDDMDADDTASSQGLRPCTRAHMAAALAYQSRRNLVHACGPILQRPSSARNIHSITHMPFGWPLMHEQKREGAQW